MINVKFCLNKYNTIFNNKDGSIVVMNIGTSSTPLILLYDSIIICKSTVSIVVSTD